MNKAYKVKNEIINIIQKNNGFDEEALKQIQDYMAKVGYRTIGNCDANENNTTSNRWYGAGVTGNNVDVGTGAFCIRKVTSSSIDETDYTNAQFPESVYYQIKVFYSIDLPIVRRLFTFANKGSTKRLYYPCTNNGSQCIPLR